MELRVTLSGPRLRAVPDRPTNRFPVSYGLGGVFQVAPRLAAVVVNRRIGAGPAVVDLEDGADGVVFDSLDALDAARGIPLSWNQDAVHPETGEKLLMVAHQSTAGFVPLGARLADGAPHPAAGTGFSIVTYVGYLAGLTETNHAVGRQAYAYRELQQLCFDGQSLRVTDRRRLEPRLGHVTSLGHPLSVPIPDGPDLITAQTGSPALPPGPDGNVCIPCRHPHANPRLGRNSGSGFARWRYSPEHGWQPVSWVSVSGADLSTEPTLVRDTDGALLMSVRGKGLAEPPGSVTDGLENTYEHFRVYRSADNGATWERAIHLPRLRNATPVVLNRTAGGQPYLAANPWVGGPDSRGRKVMSTRRRARLAVWPLTPDRRGVEPPVLVLDCDARFGPPRPVDVPQVVHDNNWGADHPIGNVVQLGDGRWHGLLAFRVHDIGLNAGGLGPTPEMGCWIEEVTVPGETPAPVWLF